MKIIAAVAIAFLLAAGLALALFFLAPPPVDLSNSANRLAAPRPRPTSAVATPRAETTGFNGTFEGTLEGDEGSSTEGTLVLVQDGRDVTGTFTVGEGLFVDGGRCGVTEVPVGSQSATGTVDPRDPTRMTAEVPIEVAGLKLKIILEGELSADDQTLTGMAKADLPFLCGRDPVITGELIRQ